MAARRLGRVPAGPLAMGTAAMMLCAHCQTRPPRPRCSSCRYCRTALRRANRAKTKIKGHEGYKWQT